MGPQLGRLGQLDIRVSALSPEDPPNISRQASPSVNIDWQMIATVEYNCLFPVLENDEAIHLHRRLRH
jgi:hypothetical protein